MDKIIGVLQALKEDKPQVIITDELIKQVIEDCMELLIDEIRTEL